MTTTNVRSRRRRRIQADAAVLDDDGDGDDDDGRNQKQQQCPIRIDRLRYQYQQQLLQQQQQQQQQQEVVSSTASSDGNGEGNDEKGNVFPVDAAAAVAAAAAAAAVNSNLTASDDSLLLEEEEEEEEEATVFSNNSNSNNITVDDSNFNDDDKLLFAEEEEEEDFLPNDDDNTTAVTSSSSFTSSYSDADTDTDSSSTPAEADTAVPIWNSHQYDPLMMSDDYFGGGDFRRNRDRNRQRQRQRRIMDDEDDVASSTYTVPSFLDETIFTQQKSVTEENRHKEFQNTFAIKLGHGIVGLKRWGHTKNITMNGSSSDDYRMGLISIAIVVIVVVFIWLILLEIFRRLGPKRVGYILSGPKRKKGNDNAASSENDDDDHIMRAGATNVKEKEDENKNKNEDILNMKYLSENTPRWLFPKKANKNKINMRRVKSFFSTTTGNYHCSDDDNDNYSFSSSSSSDSSYSSSSSCSSRSRSRGSDDDDEESGVISQSGRMSARSTDILSTSSQNDVSTDTSHFYKVGVIRDGVLDVSQQHHQDDDHQDDENTSVVGKDKDWGKDSVSLSTVARPQQQQQQWEEMLLYTGLVLCDPSSYSNYNNNNINNNANNTSFGTGNFSYGCYGSKNVYATEDDSNRNTRTRTDDDDDLQHDILRDLQRMEQEQERESSTIDNEEPSSSRLHHYEIHELRDLQHLELEHEISKIQIQQPKQQQQQQQQQQQHRHQEIPVSMIYSLLEDGGLVLSQKQQQQQQQQQARENHHHNIALEEGVEIWYDLQSKRFFSSSNSCNSNSNHNRNNNSIDSSTINDSDNYAANSKKRNKGGRRRSSGGGGGGLGQKSKIKYKNYDVNGYAGIKAKEYSPSHLTSSAGGPRHRQQSMTPTTIDGSSSSSASSCNSILDTDDDKGNNNNNSNNEHEHEHCNGIDSYRQQREHRCSRIVFISAGICIIISGLSMAIFGVSLLKESATKTLKVLEQVDGLTTKGMNIMDTFLDSSQSSMSSSSITNAATATAATAGDRTGSTNATTDLVDGEDSNNDSLYNVFERVMVLLIRTDKNDINDNNKSNNSNSVEQEEGGNCGAAILDNLDETIQQVNDYWNNNNNTTDNSTSPTITMSIWKNYVSKLDMIKQDVNYISDSVNYLYGLIVTHHEWIYQIIRLYNILLALFCAFILLLGTSNNNNNNNNSMSTATARPRNHVSDSTTKKRKQNRHRYRSFYCWIIPFFIMFVIMSFITSIVFLVGSTTLADICMDNPDEKIIQFLQSSKQQQRDKFSSLNYDMAIYYVNQCPIEEIPIELTSTIKLGWDITGELWDASHLMVESRQIIEDVCSTSFDTIISEAVELSASSAATDALKEGEIVQDVACNFSVMLQDLVDLFQCDNWYHLYEAAVYDALCHGWGSGFFLVSITQLIIVIMSLIMLTFRIGYNNFDYNYNISNDNNNTKMSCEDEDREGGDHHDNTMIIIEDEDEDHGVNVDDEVGGVKNKPIHRQSLRIDKGGRSTNPHPHHKDGAYYHHTAATGEVRKGKLVRSVSDNVIVTASPFDDNHDYDDNDVNVNNVNDTSHMKMPQPPKQPKMGWLRQQQQQRHQILQQPDLHQFRSSSKVFHQSIGKNDNNDVDDDGNNGGSFLNYHDCDWDDDNGENMSAIEAPDSPSSRMRTIRTPPYFDIVERNQQQQAADNNGYKNDYYEPPNVEVCLKKTRINGNNDYGNGDEQSINTIDGVLMSPIVNRTITTTETDYENAYNDYDNNDRMMMKNLTTSTYGEDFATSSQVVETIDEKQRQRQRQRRLLKRPTQSSFSKAKATTTVTDNSRTANSITEEAARVRKRIEEIKDRRARLMKRQLGKSLE